MKEEKESIEKIIKYIIVVVIDNFVISKNDESNTYFYEEDNCMSNIDADNELNFLVNDATDENELKMKKLIIFGKHANRSCKINTYYKLLVNISYYKKQAN